MLIHFLFTCALAKILKDRQLTITTEGSWTDTPLLAEAASFIADANGEAYWAFLRGLNRIEKIPDTIESIGNYAISFLTDELKSLLDISLNTRAYSPRIDLFRQISKQYTSDMNIAFAVFGDKALFSLNELKDILDQGGKSRPVVYPFEPRWGTSRDTIIIYCPISEPILFEYLSLLQEYEEYYSFVLRPIGQPSDKLVKLRGYGFEARPFNYSMTYSNNTFQNITEGKETSDTPLMKKKRIIPGPELPNTAQLPTQIIQFCKTTDDPFGSLVELSENFPLFASNISRIPCVKSLTDKIMKKPEKILSGASAIYVNGRLIRTPDIYHILQATLDELRISQILREHYGLSKDSLNKSLHLQLEKLPPNDFVLDYRSSFLYSMNDLETGKAYKNWTSILTSLLTKQPANIRRNVFNAVFFIDPVDNSDMKILSWMDEQIRASAPIHFSYFITPRNSSRYAKRVLYAWAHIRLKHGAEKAHQFLLAARKAAQKGEKLKETHYRSAYQTYSKSPKWQGLDELFDPKSRESKYLRRMRNFFEHFGINGPGALFNGKYYPGKRGDKNMQTFYMESLTRIHQLMLSHTLERANDTIDAILTGDDVFTRFNPLVQHKDKSPSEFIPLTSQSYYFQKEFIQWTKGIRYNYTSQDVKFGTFWVFIGDELGGSMESRHISMEITSFIKNMPSDARIAFFCEGGLHKIVMNARPPPFVQDILQLKPDEVTIVFNGRLIRMKGRVIYDWTAEDFEMLYKWEYHRSVSMVKNFFTEDVDLNYDALKDDIDHIDSSFHSQLALYLSFVYGYASHNGIQRFPLDIAVFKEGNPAVMNFPNKDSLIHYSVIFNPFDITFQSVAPIVKYLRDTKSFDINIYINFDADNRVYPSNFQSFHRYLISNDEIVFDRFESNTVYSIISHPAENWMITPTLATFDLDNFRPSTVQPGITVCKYKVASILVEGSALDEQYIPVHGLRINLDMGERGKFDSLSIKTMGYFQLQSQPGVWNLTMGEGPSRTVYNISSTSSITVSSFVPQWITMLVNHNEGMSRYSIFNLPKELKPVSKNQDSIHVFIVISGEMYEHLSKIMMISVMKNTNYSVHFWFLQNFISAQFKEDLSTMSKKYDFEYHFVEYHWPHWLTRQSERQRVIWGNKILFLDALFPMNLSRIIYIDADAVVRGDLIRLMRADLKGNPYAFVPFCTSRKEMSQYHFWTKGYWKRHLDKKKYHISAMFVVDLDRFRRMGAGDKLRNHYENIVGDRHSLSNLDQDLPNDIQYEVPIYSLPRRWLWCCTWCSEFEKDDAMIIDLANNPVSKISKIDMAKKHIEEWVLLDDEASHFKDPNYFKEYNLTKIREEHRKLTGSDEEKPRKKKSQINSEL